MKAVILYDEFDCAAKANALFERATQRADDILPWTVKPWRLDMLASPLTADAALADAADAHLVLLSLRHPSLLPGWVMDWLEQWAAGRRVHDAALAVWDGGDGDTLAANATPELTQFAEHHGLSFIYGDAGLVGEDLPVLVRDLQEREAQTTPTQKGSREGAPLPQVNDWGINE